MVLRLFGFLEPDSICAGRKAWILFQIEPEKTTQEVAKNWEWTVNDMRLIDVDERIAKWKAAMLHMVKESDGRHAISMEVLIEDLKNAPTVEAVPVVRCGECEKRNKSADLTYTIYCPWLGLQMGKTDFCSYGERKENNHD